MNDLKTEIKKVLYRFLQDGISSDEATQQIVEIISNIKKFDFDASALPILEQAQLRMILSTGKVHIKVVTDNNTAPGGSGD